MKTAASCAALFTGMLIAGIASAEMVTMNATFRFTDTDDVLHPAQGIRVEFWDNDGSWASFSEIVDDLLGAVQTDSNGVASLTVENVDPDESGTIDLFFRVATISDAAKVRKLTFADPYTLWYQKAGEDIIGPIFDTEMTVGNPTNASETTRAVHVHQAIQFMHDYATDVLGATVPVELLVRYDDQLSKSGASIGSMRVRGSAYDEWDVIQHEYGHVIGLNNDFHANPISQNHSFGNDNIGTLGPANGTRIAWDEGVATYLGLSSQKSGDLNGVFGNMPAGYGDEFYNAGGGNLAVSIEDASGSVGEAAGEGDELSVMRIMWDLYYNDNESYGGGHGDRFALGDTAVFELMKGNYTLHALWKDAVAQQAPTFRRRAELGEIFQEYNVSAIPSGPADGANFDATKVQFSFQEQNSDHSDQFRIVVFNHSFEYIVEASPILDSTMTQWMSETKFIAGQFHWVVLNDSVVDAGGGDPLTDFYWSGGRGFFIDFTAHQYWISAGGDSDPGPGPGGMINGDFQILSLGNPSDPAGDGLDEQTTWVLDFTDNPNFSRITAGLPLTSAVLTLRLTAADAGIADDLIQIDGLGPIAVAAIQGLTPGATATIQLELLDYYSSERILAVLDAGVFGEIPLTYTDDAIISFARLDMIPVPEPTTATLLAAGLLLIAPLRGQIPKLRSPAAVA